MRGRKRGSKETTPSRWGRNPWGPKKFKGGLWAGSPSKGPRRVGSRGSDLDISLWVRDGRPQCVRVGTLVDFPLLREVYRPGAIYDLVVTVSNGQGDHTFLDLVRLNPLGVRAPRTLVCQTAYPPVLLCRILFCGETGIPQDSGDPLRQHGFVLRF